MTAKIIKVKKMKKILFTLMSAIQCVCITWNLQLDAEIEYIVVKWLPTACLPSCVQTIAQQLSTIPIAEMVLNQQQGQATLRWKPRVPFSYGYINTAMRTAGPGVQDVRVKVRGTIIVTGSAVILQSLGDETQFILLSPAQANLNQYVAQHSIDSHVLAPGTMQKFIEGQRDSTVVVVEGPLFEPQRMQGLYLIVQQATFNRLAK